MSGGRAINGSMTVTFLHTSDLQIGMTRKFLDTDAQSRFEQSRIDTIRTLGKVAVENSCDFIVMAGDVFEHNALSRRTFGRALEELKRLPVPVYILSGNHDPLVADSQLLQLGESAGRNVVVFQDSQPLSLTTPAGELVELVGAPLLAKYATHDLVAAALEGLAPVDHVRICVGHGQAQARHNAVKPDLINLDVVTDAISRGVIDYLALGDTHSAQQVDAAGHVWFSGAPETTDFLELSTGGGENNSGNALVVSISKVAGETASVEVRQVSVGTWTFEAPVKEINSLADAQEFVATLEAYENKHTTVIKYALVGTVDMATAEYLEQEIDRLRPVFGALYERERLMDLHLEPTDEDLESLGLGGFFSSALTELIDHATPPEQVAARSVEDIASDIAAAHASSDGDDSADVDEAAPELSPAQKSQRAARDAINLLFRLSKES